MCKHFNNPIDTPARETMAEHQARVGARLMALDARPAHRGPFQAIARYFRNQDAAARRGSDTDSTDASMLVVIADGQL